MYLNCTQDELEDLESAFMDPLSLLVPLKNILGPEGNSEPRSPRTPRTPQTAQGRRDLSAPRTPAQFLVPSTPTQAQTPFRFDANAPPFIPPSLPDKAILKAKISSFDHRASLSESGGESSDADDLNAEYVRLKLQIGKLTSERSQSRDNAETMLIRDLRARLEAIKMDYFFDEKEADVQYEIERQKADAATLQSRLRGEVEPDVLTTKRSPQRRQPTAQSHKVPSPLAIPDLFDDDSEDSSGGLFKILNDTTTTDINDHNTRIRVRDMALPKHWSGRTPKSLLSEAVTKADRYAAISYHVVSGNSRAKRAAVNIRWNRRKMGDHVMKDVACLDETQAEQYIATVALHALTFPTTEGFVAGMPSASGSQTFFRLLPAVFRDLWDELEVTRKASHDAVNRSVWATLRSVLEPKLEMEWKVRTIQIY
jgi:ATP-dependent RNA helicase DHX29